MPASALYMAAHGDIVGTVGKDHRRPLVLHQLNVFGGVARITAADPMLAELPYLAASGNDRPCSRWDYVFRLRLLVACFMEEHIDLAELETGDGQVQMQIGQDDGELLQLLDQDLAIPASALGELVIGEHEGPL